MATCLGCDPEMGDGKALCRVSGAVAFISCEPGASARNWFMDFRFLASASAKKINEVALAESGGRVQPKKPVRSKRSKRG